MSALEWLLRVPWQMSLFVLLMLPLVLALGTWQLQRAGYKQGLEDSYFDQIGALPMALPPIGAATDFSRVRLQGTFGKQRYLLDNQLRDGVPGYWLYQSFHADSGRLLLVNRGWFAATDRADFEIPEAPAGTLSVVALVWPDTGLLPLFGAPPVERLGPDLWRLQRLDWTALGGSQTAMEPVEWRLEPGQPGVLVAAPQSIGFGVDRHRGYAAQWFGLALALLTGYAVLWRRALTGRH